MAWQDGLDERLVVDNAECNALEFRVVPAHAWPWGDVDVAAALAGLGGLMEGLFDCFPEGIYLVFPEGVRR